MGARRPRPPGSEPLLPLQQQSRSAPTDRRRRSENESAEKNTFLEASQRGERHDGSPAAEQEAALQGTRGLLTARRSWASEGLSRTALQRPGCGCIPPA